MYSQLDSELIMLEIQRVLDHIHLLIKELGKIDLRIGGIGINGHIAFKEPDASLDNDE
ncbi:hypothetical protein ABPH35_05155 [Streptococcus sp. ZJ93]|uniref:hypothetical protein n=1 Tax=Streptococcus handemini TaxID=3161188 RepID=UPI0032F0873C